MSNTPLPQFIKDQIEKQGLKPGVYTIEYVIDGAFVYPSKNQLLSKPDPSQTFKQTFTYIVPEPEYLNHGNGD